MRHAVEGGHHVVSDHASDVRHGVALLVRDGVDLGVEPMHFESHVDQSQLAGACVEAPGLPKVGLMSAYFLASEGLGQINLGLLADIAVQQDRLRLPIIVAGDFNLNPAKIESTDFLSRASLTLVAPEAPTCRKPKSSNVLDYFLVSETLSEWT